MPGLFDELLERIRKIIEELLDNLDFGGGRGGSDEEGGGREQGGDEVPVGEVDIKNDPSVISPPIVYDPHYACSPVVLVLAFIPGATIEIELNGSVVVTQVAGNPLPQGEAFAMPDKLAANDRIRARQTINGVTSDWSSEVVVRDHTVDYPAGPPRPQINPAPVHECGARTGVANLLVGCNVWITADGTEVGRVDGAGKPQTGVNVNPDYALGQQVVAWAEMCADPSPPSETHVTQPEPSPLPTPGFEDAYAGSSQVTVTQLANGARFTVTRGGSTMGPFRTWGQRHYVNVSPALSAGEVLTAQQTMCPGSPPSGEGTTTVKDCSALPAPGVGPIQDGDTQVVVTSFVSDATIRVWIGSTKVGESGGPIVQLSQAVSDGDIVRVQQVVGTCEGSTVREITTKCVAPPVGADPAGVDLFPVGTLDYDGGTTTIDGITHSVKGTVYYPADADGVGTPFRGPLAALGRVPIVFMAHGNHAKFRDPNNWTVESCTQGSGMVEIPNHAGYDYFQRQLARMGIIAASVYSNDTNCKGYSVANMTQRAQLVIRSIEHFQSLDSGGDPIFGGKVDFARVGLMGHSRGGEAVVTVPEIISTPGVTIAGVISLAPTDAGASSGAPKVPFLTILPAADGDVSDNDGAKYYDAGTPSPIKVQVYVDRANHNFFNRQWPLDEGVGPAPRLSRAEHERILSAYGCAFFRHTLLGHNTSGYLTNRVVPPTVPLGDVHLSFVVDGNVTVDHHDDGNGIGTNSVGGPTSTSGGLTADEYDFSQGGSSFNGTFFGDTVGMVAESREKSGEFRSELDRSVDLTDLEIWVRAGEVFEGSLPSEPATFDVGAEDGNGTIGWVASDDVGGVPRPFVRSDYTKTMPSTLRFPAACFAASAAELTLDDIRAIWIRPTAADGRPLAFDDLQVVKP